MASGQSPVVSGPDRNFEQLFFIDNWLLTTSSYEY